MRHKPLDASSALEEWLDAIASQTPAPAGGSSAAITAALAGALAAMVARLTAMRATDASASAQARSIATEADELRHRFLDSAREDAEAVSELMAALKNSARATTASAERDAAREQAFLAAADGQYRLLLDSAELADLALWLSRHGRQSAVCDSATAVLLAATAARSAYWNVRADVGGLIRAPKGSPELLAAAREKLAKVEEAEREALRILKARYG